MTDGATSSATSSAISAGPRRRARSARASRVPIAARVLACCALLTGCAQGQYLTQAERIGPDSGGDSCRPYLVALDATGNYYTRDILTGAAVGAAGGASLGALLGQNLKSTLIGAAAGAVAGGAAGYWTALQQKSQDEAVLSQRFSGDIARDNAEIDRTQLAFNALTDCRVRQADAIRADYRAQRIDRPTALARMAQVKQWARHDAEVGRRIESRIQDRSAQFQTAAEHLSPGTDAAVATAYAPPPSRPATLREAAPLTLHPGPTAPSVASLPAGAPVTVTAAQGGYALVQTPTGERGYTPLSALAGPGASPNAENTPQLNGGGEVRTLAGSNAARRDQFAQSVSVASHNAADGFDLSG